MIPVFSETICTDNGDENKLTCVKCKQDQYRMYRTVKEIKMFMTKKYRNLFVL